MVRPRSLELSLEGLPAEATVDGPVALRLAIFNSLKDAGVETSTIEGIECYSKNLWFVVFNTRNDRQKYREHKIKLCEKEFVLNSNEARYISRPTYIFVRAYGYPLDAEREILEQTLSLYGDLVELVDDVDRRMGIKTGVRHAKFSKLNENIPSFIYAGKYQVRTNYRNQPQTCRNCHQEGHNAKDCKAGKVCKQCGKAGHTKGDCPERRCFYCKGKGHEMSNCQKYVTEFPGLGKTPTGTVATSEKIPSTTISDNTPTSEDPPSTSELPPSEPIPPEGENSQTTSGMETEIAQKITEATETNDPTPKPTDDPKRTDEGGENNGTKDTNDNNDREPLSEASDWGAGSNWDGPNTMDTETEDKAGNEDRGASSSTESGDEPPLKTSKTKDQITGETKKTKTKKKKKRKKNDKQQTENTSHKRPPIKVAAGKSRHPF